HRNVLQMRLARLLSGVVQTAANVRFRVVVHIPSIRQQSLQQFRLLAQIGHISVLVPSHSLGKASESLAQLPHNPPVAWPVLCVPCPLSLVAALTRVTRSL